jgi:DNA-binding response OmpR family regulator
MIEGAGTGGLMEPVGAVLVVEDEVPLAKVVASYLEREGFAVNLAHDGPSAVEEARALHPDLIVLDLMLPGFDGLEVCRRIRTFTDAYIIMLTARDEETDKVIALSVGADDYIVKPFSPRELIARAKAMLRRPRAAAGGELSPVSSLAGLVVDPDARRAILDGDPVELTRTEFDILATLIARPRSAFTRRQLLEAVWGPGWYGDEHVVDVHVAHLRRKLADDATTPRFIRTVRGVGYGMAKG